MKFFRIDEVKTKYVNCPLAVRSIVECINCPAYLGTQPIMLEDYVKCRADEVLNKNEPT